MAFAGEGSGPSYGETIDALKGWVTGGDEAFVAGLAEGTVLVQVTHSNLRQRIIELRVDLHSTVGNIKTRLHTFNGTNPAYMELQLFEGERLVARMLDDTKMLGYYGVRTGMHIHVVDNDPYSLSRNGGLDDTSQVEKYRMSDEDYDKRSNTLRAWKKEQLKKDPHFRFVPKPGGKAAAGGGGGGVESADSVVDYEDASLVAGMEVGMRCECKPGDRRGEVRYVGKVTGTTGYWVGVRLDEPMGRGDGTKNGKKYFDAAPSYGSFVRPDFVKVGDYPERGFSDLEDEDDDADKKDAAGASEEACCASGACGGGGSGGGSGGASSAAVSEGVGGAAGEATEVAAETATTEATTTTTTTTTESKVAEEAVRKEEDAEDEL